jgi:DNA segregation ATPase FtsK/SpoIIIE-like protein
MRPQDRAELEHEADSIERVLGALSIPVRVRGGQVREGRVRFRLSEQAGGMQPQLKSALDAVAAALGTPQVELAREGSGLALEVHPAGEQALRLLPLLDLLRGQPPLHAALGMDLDGRPLVVDLAGPSSWHLLVVGAAGTGKSELLRSALIALALGTPPLEMRILGIDLTGRELSPLEALPHALCELATEPRFARELLDWAVAQVRSPSGDSSTRPHLMVWVDDVGSLASAGLSDAVASLRLLLQHGPAADVHLMLAGRPQQAQPLVEASRDGAVHALADPTAPGMFLFSSLRGRRMARLAWLPARDLNQAVRLVEAHWLGAGEAA